MSDTGKEQTPKVQSPSAGGPAIPRKAAGRDSAGQPAQVSSKTVYLLDPMVVRDLATALQLKPFKVVADLMQMQVFKSLDDTVNFETASLIAKKHGYRPERPPPGMLVL